MNLPRKLWGQGKDEGYNDREFNIDEEEELTPDLLSELEEGQPSEFAILKEVRSTKDSLRTISMAYSLKSMPRHLFASCWAYLRSPTFLALLLYFLCQ
jgi:hypothetical protein